jgi:cytochrome bd ubiquinol oxidase subunit II
MALFSIACVWTPLSVAEVARRWLTLPGSLLFVAIAIALVAVSVVFWRSIWSLQSYARLLRLAVAMTVLAFIGFGATIWPYAIPYRISIVEGAGDLASIKFALVGIVVVLPVVLTYQLYAYRVFRGKALEIESSYGTAMGPDICSRRTHEREPHLHLS